MISVACGEALIVNLVEVGSNERGVMTAEVGVSLTGSRQIGTRQLVMDAGLWKAVMNTIGAQLLAQESRPLHTAGTAQAMRMGAITAGRRMLEYAQVTVTMASMRPLVRIIVTMSVVGPVDGLGVMTVVTFVLATMPVTLVIATAETTSEVEGDASAVAMALMITGAVAEASMSVVVPNEGTAPRGGEVLMIRSMSMLPAGAAGVPGGRALERGSTGAVRAAARGRFFARPRHRQGRQPTPVSAPTQRTSQGGWQLASSSGWQIALGGMARPRRGRQRKCLW